jgi:hypothetical protein
LVERSSSGHFQRVIDQSLDLFHKSKRVRELRVADECGFIPPARVDVEHARISDSAEGLDEEGSRFLSGWAQDFLDGGGDGVLPPVLRAEAGKNKHLRRHCGFLSEPISSKKPLYRVMPFSQPCIADRAILLHSAILGHLIEFVLIE